jgi:hypothetical protein
MKSPKTTGIVYLGTAAESSILRFIPYHKQHKECYNKFLLVGLHGLKISLKNEYSISISENEVLIS